MSVCIAVVQFKITHLDRQKNFSRIETFIQKAKKQQADIIIFPEDCITGSIFGDLSKLDSTKENLRMWQKLAAQYAIDIVTGSSMEATPDGNFNTSYYVDATGTVLGTYRKNHLYPSEHVFLKPGTEAPVFNTAYGRVGIVICWDMLFPEIFMRLKQEGVQIIFCPSYWYREIAESMAAYNPRSEEQQMDAMCLTRALEANAVMVYCNAAGVAQFANGSTDTLIGHSQIVVPVLGAIKRLSHNYESMFVYEVNTDLLHKSAKIYLA